MRIMVTKDTKEQLEGILSLSNGIYKEEEVYFGWCLSLNNNNGIVGDAAGINAYYLKNYYKEEEGDRTQWRIHADNNIVIKVYKEKGVWLYEGKSFMNIESLLTYLQKKHTINDMYAINFVSN